MDWIASKRTIFDYLKKYKSMILVLLAGMVLMMWPDAEETKEAPAPANMEMPLQESLEEILEKISGTGQVSVLLTQSAGEETIYQTDENSSVQDNENTIHRQTVLVSGTGR